MKKTLIPIILACVLVIGILIGNFFAMRQGAYLSGVGGMNNGASSGDKISDLIQIIDNAYVDSVPTDSIEESIIPMILKQLDPHSAYIPASDLEAVNEELGGSFSGIGVQFNLQNDTIYVVDVISGGPSEKAGLRDGDRIVTVNDTLFVGKSINNEKVMKRLRGPKGSVVELGIVRQNAPKMLRFKITRGDIPVHSIDVSYMVTPEIGYISVNKFGANTYKEFLTAIAKLQKANAKKLIIDLRGNAGGYMDAAVNMLNEFLKKGDLIVYVKGKAYPRSDSYANGNGSCQNMKIAVLIDEFSGSASEIFAGAIQDNDRGTIVGRRSFGKGLVQQQVDFSDGSAVRITVARYYTPSGRCIQKPYERGNSSDYESDILNRYLHGEFFSKDSIHQTDTVAYKTVGGRTVYGGGGIMRDVFVPRDTIGFTPYFNALANGGHIYQYALLFTEKERAKLSTYKDWKTLSAYLDTQNLQASFDTYASAKGVKGSAHDKAVSKEIITRQLKSYVLRTMLGDAGFFPYLNSYDMTVKKAVEKLK